jgi:FMN phosphatase YigB (HAD superfamily)
LFMVTSSDARLKMQPDGQFIYDPEFSEALKRKRIELLKGKGLKFDAISIGDPEDKPHPDFFNKALRVAEAEIGAPVDTRNAIMLGDSYGGDLQTPKEILGFGMVVLRENGKPSVQINDASQVSLGALTEAERFLV